MLRIEEMIEIQILRKQGKSLNYIAKETGRSINTVRSYLRKGVKTERAKQAPRPQKLDKHRDYLQLRVKQAYPKWIPATVLYREIQTQGYKGKLSRLRAYLRSLKPVVRAPSLIRFETKPGEQMQVDYAHFHYGTWVFYAFVALLCYSRMAYVEFVLSQQLEVLLDCHEHCFTYWGGVPQQVVYDNMKTVVLRRNAYGKGKHQLQPTFLDFAKHYGFKPCLCRPYHPQSKGKVERFIRYLRESFFIPWITQQTQEVMLTPALLNAAVRHWLETVANVREHADRQAQPYVLWQQERDELQPLPKAYPFARPQAAQNGFVADNSNHLFLATTSLQHDLAIYDAVCQGGVV